jgi:hypothetical protein
VHSKCNKDQREQGKESFHGSTPVRKLEIPKAGKIARTAEAELFSSASVKAGTPETNKPKPNAILNWSSSLVMEPTAN